MLSHAVLLPQMLNMLSILTDAFAKERLVAVA